VSSLQDLLRICENELLDFSMCLTSDDLYVRVLAQGINRNVKNLVIVCGQEYIVRYLGVFIVLSSVFCCSFDNAKKSFYLASDSIFGKVGRL